MIGQPLAFYEGYHICLLFVVVEEKIISEKSIMRCNANYFIDEDCPRFNFPHLVVVIKFSFVTVKLMLSFMSLFSRIFAAAIILICL